MKRTPRPRKTAELSESLHQQLTMYALAASAAGVGLLALAPPAEARIVYTPVHQVIHKDSSLRIDLNHDGSADFVVYNTHGVSKSSRWNFIVVESLQSNEGIIGSNPFYFVSFSALNQGAQVGYGARFLVPQNGHGILIAQCANTDRTNSAPPCETNNTFNTSGHWANVKNRYLGLEFPINGKTHYAWARLSVEVSRKPFRATAVLTGYAYETIPNKSILAGATKGPDDAEPTAANMPTREPATLGMLALGAPGLAIWRREESEVATPHGGIS